MIARLSGRLAALTLLISCGQHAGPPLSSSDLVIYAPLPGRTTSVAYLTLQNHSEQAIVLRDVRSENFARTEMHETLIADGVARMRALDSVGIDANGSVAFVAGGRHIMLLDPIGTLRPGDPVSLELHFGGGETLLLQAPLSARTVN